LSAQALDLARSLNDPETHAQVLLARDYTITAPENAAERFAATSELLEIAEQLGDPVLASRALGLRFKAAMELADVAEAERCQSRNQQLTPDLGQPVLTWLALHHYATLRVLHGGADAEAAISAAYEAGVNAGRRDIELFSMVQRLSLYFEQGRSAELADWTRHAVEGMPNFPMGHAVYASMLAEMGQLDAAAELLDRIVAGGFAHSTNNVGWLRFAAECAWLCARFGRAECVPVLWPRLAPYTGQLVVISFAGGVAGSVAFYLGLLCTTVADWEQADRYFAAAAATHDRIGAPAWLARTRVEWARMLLARADPGDGERAHDLLRQALGTARDLGLANIERGAVELLSSQ
jgi:hypothetical protein